jgi:hypothetical protein
VDLGAESGIVGFDIGEQAGVAVRELVQRQQVSGSGLERAPPLD